MILKIQKISHLPKIAQNPRKLKFPKNICYICLNCFLKISTRMHWNRKSGIPWCAFTFMGIGYNDAT